MSTAKVCCAAGMERLCTAPHSALDEPGVPLIRAAAWCQGRKTAMGLAGAVQDSHVSSLLHLQHESSLLDPAHTRA